MPATIVETNQARRIAVLITDAFGSHGGIQVVNGNIVQAIAERPGLESAVFSLCDRESREPAIDGDGREKQSFQIERASCRERV